MTNKDNTREKLMDSMRKTKSASNDVQNSTAAASASSRKKKAAPKSRSKSRPQSGTNKKAGVASAVPVADPYQGGRRVWPD